MTYRYVFRNGNMSSEAKYSQVINNAPKERRYGHTHAYAHIKPQAVHDYLTKPK